MNITTNQRSTRQIEPLLTINEAARLIGLPTWKIRRAVKSGLLRSYRFANQRRLVRLSDIEIAIEASARGGQRD